MPAAPCSAPGPRRPRCYRRGGGSTRREPVGAAPAYRHSGARPRAGRREVRPEVRSRPYPFLLSTDNDGWGGREDTSPGSGFDRGRGRHAARERWKQIYLLAVAQHRGGFELLVVGDDHLGGIRWNGEAADEIGDRRALGQVDHSGIHAAAGGEIFSQRPVKLCGDEHDREAPSFILIVGAESLPSYPRCAAARTSVAYVNLGWPSATKARHLVRRLIVPWMTPISATPFSSPRYIAPTMSPFGPTTTLRYKLPCAAPRSFTSSVGASLKRPTCASVTLNSSTTFMPRLPGYFTFAPAIAAPAMRPCSTAVGQMACSTRSSDKKSRTSATSPAA